MPLLEITGITSLGYNFWVAFCFLHSEKEVVNALRECRHTVDWLSKQRKNGTLFYSEWLALVNALTSDAFDTAYDEFKIKWNDKCWHLIDYLDETWFRLLKTRFVRA
ncbi:MAG: hypothetical protein FRX48_04766 [Lasallia pustulata]|uniref:Uncharacterized protein n=1 Tax=Lasallia pustulata TaxID=136370 RepID=A0A5M8PPK3_9LECA|nr:MAG: hypothetical protein FRX48_04766 [Lasallia pustulata]